MSILFKAKPDLSHIPSDFGLPYFGNAFPFLKDAMGLIRNSRAKYGDIFKSRFFGIECNKFLGDESSNSKSYRKSEE